MKKSYEKRCEDVKMFSRPKKGKTFSQSHRISIRDLSSSKNIIFLSTKQMQENLEKKFQKTKQKHKRNITKIWKIFSFFNKQTEYK